MISLILALAIVQDVPCLRAATARADAFDMAGARAQVGAARDKGCGAATVAGWYLDGLAAAKRAYAVGGSKDSLKPVEEAIAALERVAGAVPGPARIAAFVLHAAAAAAQSERDEMAVYLDEAIRIESLQLAAHQPPAPVISAHEAAGDLWLEVHRFDDAQHAYERASAQVGSNPRIVLGRARVAARLDDASACADYRNLLAWWGSRAEMPQEIVEAKEYVRRRACALPPGGR